MPTQGSANPGLTIQSIAARTADYLISQKASIFSGETRDLNAPPVRTSLSPLEPFAAAYRISGRLAPSLRANDPPRLRSVRFNPPFYQLE